MQNTSFLAQMESGYSIVSEKLCWFEYNCAAEKKGGLNFFYD